LLVGRQLPDPISSDSAISSITALAKIAILRPLSNLPGGVRFLSGFGGGWSSVDRICRKHPSRKRLRFLAAACAFRIEWQAESRLALMRI